MSEEIKDIDGQMEPETGLETEDEAGLDSAEGSDGDAGADLVVVEFENKEEDLFQGAQISDIKGGLLRRRMFQSIAVVLVLFLFVPELFTLDGNNPLNWVMLVVAVALLIAIWTVPDYQNRKFARSKAERIPHVRLEVSKDGIEVYEGQAHHKMEYGKGTAAFEYKNVIAFHYGKNRVLTIPKDQLSKETVEELRRILKKGLQDLFEKVETQKK